MKYRHVGRHADTLATGAPIGPGEFVTLTDAQAKEEPLIEQGILISAESQKGKQKEADE